MMELGGLFTPSSSEVSAIPLTVWKRSTLAEQNKRYKEMVRVLFSDVNYLTTLSNVCDQSVRITNQHRSHEGGEKKKEKIIIPIDKIFLVFLGFLSPLSHFLLFVFLFCFLFLVFFFCLAFAFAFVLSVCFCFRNRGGIDDDDVLSIPLIQRKKNNENHPLCICNFYFEFCPSLPFLDSTRRRMKVMQRQ